MTDFKECPICSAVGSFQLCNPCAHNKTVISNLNTEVDYWKDKYKGTEDVLDILWNILKVTKGK